MEFNCIKAAAPLRGYSLLFNTKSLVVPDAYLIDFSLSRPWNHQVVSNPGPVDW